VELRKATELSDAQPQKASAPIDVTDEGIVTHANDVQPQKLAGPIEVTEEGMLMETSDTQPLKLSALIEVTPYGISAWPSASTMAQPTYWAAVLPKDQLLCYSTQSDSLTSRGRVIEF
jgi:hypothetical protein